VNESDGPPTARSAHDTAYPAAGGSPGPAGAPPSPQAAARPPGWTGGRITALFTGIGSSAAVDRYLAGVRHAVITDFWDNQEQACGGGSPGSAPGTQGFWAASATGPGTQTLRWDPASGSWTVVVMNASGRPGIHVPADLEATYPDLPWIAAGLLGAGTVFAAGAALLIAGAVRRYRASNTSTV
jgi:hypothetical protein